MFLIRIQRIRYAAPPIGELRWQAPVPPTSNRSATIAADAFGPICPQAPVSLGVGVPASTTEDPVVQSEDCLFLNVYAPQNASRLPVLVWVSFRNFSRKVEQHWRLNISRFTAGDMVWVTQLKICRVSLTGIIMVS